MWASNTLRLFRDIKGLGWTMGEENLVFVRLRPMNNLGCKWEPCLLFFGRGDIQLIDSRIC